MMSWLAKELEEGIPMSTAQDTPTVGVSAPATSTGVGPPSLNPLTSNRMISVRQGAVSRSAQVLGGPQQNIKDPFKDLSTSVGSSGTATHDMKKPSINQPQPQSQPQSGARMPAIPTSKSIANLPTKSTTSKTTLPNMQRTRSSNDVGRDAKHSKSKLKTQLSVSTKHNTSDNNNGSHAQHKESEVHTCTVIQ